MSRRRVAVVVTNRASYARIKSALQAMQARDDIDLCVIAAGSLLLEKFGSGVHVLEADGFPAVERLYVVLEGENPVTMAKTTGLAVTELASVFDRIRPDFVLTVADRYETLATAVAAAYLNLPLVHVQGGEITGSIDEKVRHAITKLADYHFVSTTTAAERVIRMGEDPSTVFVTGCPSIDLAVGAAAVVDPGLAEALERSAGVGPSVPLKPREFLIVMQHPVTTEYEAAPEQIRHTLQAVRTLEMPTLWFWPNVDAGSDQISKGIRRFREQHPDASVHFFKNLPPEQFLALLGQAACIVGNSSVAVREASFLGVPAVNIGTRQQGRERAGNVRDVPHDSGAIVAAVRDQVRVGRHPSSRLYGDGHAGGRIAELLATIRPRIEKRLTYTQEAHAGANHR